MNSREVGCSSSSLSTSIRFDSLFHVCSSTFSFHPQCSLYTIHFVPLNENLPSLERSLYYFVRSHVHFSILVYEKGKYYTQHTADSSDTKNAQMKIQKMKISRQLIVDSPLDMVDAFHCARVNKIH